MDSTTEKSLRVAELEEKQRVIEKWLVHPITKSIFDDLSTQQEKFLTIILDGDITNLETFFLHFTACGHLRGLRRFKALAEEQLGEIQEELKQETQEE